MLPTLLRTTLQAGILCACSTSISAANQYHLLGFVGQPCAHDPYCFELLVEAEYDDEVGNRITVYYDATTAIFDPENYELTLQQSKIVRGSHLRLIITADESGDKRDFRATIIWIGD
jgi:hypothetical protein